MNIRKIIGGLILVGAISVGGSYQWYKDHHHESISYIVQFPSYVTTVTNDMEPTLSAIANQANTIRGAHVAVVGHSGMSGDAQANLEISQDRADSVKIFLKQHGVDESRITASGVGSTRPLPRNQDESDRSYNIRLTRVEVTLE